MVCHIKQTETDILEIKKKIKSNNVMLRSHWSVKRTDRKEYALLVRSQMKLKKIKYIQPGSKCTIMIISYRKRLLDFDNLVGGAKTLVDALVEECLIHDDSPEYVNLIYEQYKAKQESTMVIRKF